MKTLEHKKVVIKAWYFKDKKMNNWLKTLRIVVIAMLLSATLPALALYLPGTGIVTPGYYTQSASPRATTIINPAVPGAVVLPQTGLPASQVTTTMVNPAQTTVSIANASNPIVDLPPASAPGLEDINAQIVPQSMPVNETTVREAIATPSTTTVTQSVNARVLPPTAASAQIIKPPCDPFRCQCSDVRSQLVISSAVEPPSEVNEPPRGRFIRSLRQIPTTTYTDELPGPPDLILLTN